MTLPRNERTGLTPTNRTTHGYTYQNHRTLLDHIQTSTTRCSQLVQSTRTWMVRNSLTTSMDFTQLPPVDAIKDKWHHMRGGACFKRSRLQSVQSPVVQGFSLNPDMLGTSTTSTFPFFLNYAVPRISLLTCSIPFVYSIFKSCSNKLTTYLSNDGIRMAAFHFPSAIR